MSAKIKVIDDGVPSLEGAPYFPRKILLQPEGSEEWIDISSAVTSVQILMDKDNPTVAMIGFIDVDIETTALLRHVQEEGIMNNLSLPLPEMNEDYFIDITSFSTPVILCSECGNEHLRDYIYNEPGKSQRRVMKCPKCQKVFEEGEYIGETGKVDSAG